MCKKPSYPQDLEKTDFFFNLKQGLIYLDRQPTLNVIGFHRSQQFG